MSNTHPHDPNEVKKASSSILDILYERGYQFQGKIGKGSYASVFLTKYKAKGSDNTICLACKLIDTKKVPKAFAKKFLPREIAILRKVNHPNIITVHSIFQQRHFFFIFMSLASKGDLLTFITKNGAIKEQQAYIWFRQLSEAINYLHRMNIAHRDLKCENLLLTSRYVLKLTDFGFSRWVTDERGISVKSKTFCGSVSYAPPEVISGTPYVPCKADMWSLGVVLFVMTNKAMPFDDSNVKKAYECQMSRTWNFRTKVTEFLSDDVKHVVQRLLQPNVEERWTINDVISSSWFLKNMELSIEVIEEDPADAQYTGQEELAQEDMRQLVTSSNQTVILPTPDEQSKKAALKLNKLK